VSAIGPLSDNLVLQTDDRIYGEGAVAAIRCRGLAYVREAAALSSPRAASSDPAGCTWRAWSHTPACCTFDPLEMSPKRAASPGAGSLGCCQPWISFSFRQPSLAMYSFREAPSVWKLGLEIG
jgi:hypothetical protein